MPQSLLQKNSADKKVCLVQFNTYFLRYVWYRMQVVIVYNQIHDFLSFCGVARKYDVASSSFQLSRTCRGHP